MPLVSNPLSRRTARTPPLPTRRRAGCPLRYIRACITGKRAAHTRGNSRSFARLRAQKETGPVPCLRRSCRANKTTRPGDDVKHRATVRVHLRAHRAAASGQWRWTPEAALHPHRRGFQDEAASPPAQPLLVRTRRKGELWSKTIGGDARRCARRGFHLRRHVLRSLPDDQRELRRKGWEEDSGARSPEGARRDRNTIFSPSS